MVHRRALSIIIVIVWVLIMVYLAYLSPRVFNVLTYDESVLMPNYMEPVVVSNLVHKYLGVSNKTTIMVVVKVNPNDTNEITSKINTVVNYINNVTNDANIEDLVNVYNEVYSIYNNTLNTDIDEELSNVTPQVLELYNQINNDCNKAITLNRELYGEVNNVSLTVSKQYNETLNYAQILYNNIINQYLPQYPDITLTQLFVETTRDYENTYGGSWFINELANDTLNELINNIGPDPTPYQLAQLNMTGILIDNYLSIVNMEFPGVNPLNSTSIMRYAINAVLNDANDDNLIEIALLMGPQGNIAILKMALYQEFINTTPPLVQPYLNNLICTGNSSMSSVLKDIRSELLNIATQEYKPPNMLNLPYNLTSYFLNGTYSVVIATIPSAYEYMVYDKIVSLGYVYPVSTDIILYEFEKITTGDVNIIDKVTSALVFITMLSMLGTIMGPIVSLLTLALTYLASMGILYLWAINFKLYYLSVYMIAPVIFGIGVDYSMLMLSRYLEERVHGRSPEDALREIKRVVRPTILASASIVGLGLGSFVISKFGYIQDIGIGFIVAVAMTAIATIIILPEIINILRDRVLWPMGLKAKSIELRGAFLSKMARFAVKRPKTILTVFLLVTILALAYVVLTIKITTDPIQVMPNTPAKIGLSILISNFRNYDYSTAYLVLYGNETAALALEHMVSAQDYVLNTTMAYNGSNIYIIKAIVDEQSLSDKLIPIYLSLKSLANTISRTYGAKVLIGGSPANKYVAIVSFEDEYYYLIIYVMMAINITILTIYMRSIMIPLRLVATVLMSITWSLALTIAIFQGLMGIKTYWLLPIILISLLMSVGTDYDLFIVSRFKEELMKGYSDADAIVRAVELTGPIVTGAALVLAMAFASLALSSLFMLKQIALAVAASVLIDSFLVRPLLVPAIIVLLGKYNWWPNLGVSNKRSTNSL